MGNRIKLSSIIKKGIVASLAVVMILQSLMSMVPLAYGANNYNMLGTNAALGSAILNENFIVEDWNKWEMLTWGIFLSNFAVPLVDDYESAFNSNSGKGSKGGGYKALAFGSGSDPANASTIKELLNYAVNQQKTGSLTPLYVSFSEVGRDGIKRGSTTNHNDETTEESSNVEVDTGGMRQATFKDMFLMSSADDGDAWVKLDNVTGLNNPFAKPVIIEGDRFNELGKEEIYLNMVTINEGKLPTFYIKYGAGHEKVFDYTDGWDAQILTAFIARVACGEFEGQFKDLFNDMWKNSSELNLFLDCFGNIVVTYDGGRRVVIPSSINQHLTDSPKINLISSMLFNGYNSGVSGSEMAIIGQQSVSGWFGKDWNTDVRFGGLPALGSHMTNIPQGLIMMYYDLDTIAYQNYFHGGPAANGTKEVSYGSEVEEAYKLHYGKAVKELFDLDVNKPVGNKYIFKIEAANMDKFDFDGLDGKAGDALSTTLKASGMIANITGGNVKAKVLSEIKTNNGTAKLFGEPVIIPVQMNDGRSETKINDAGVGRLFCNYLYKAYRDGKHTLAGDIDSKYVSTMLTISQSDTMKNFKESVLGTNDMVMSKLLAGFVAEKNDLFKLNVDANKLVAADIKNNKNPFKGMKDVKVDGKNAININFATDASLDYFPGRLIKAYPVSEVMRSVGNVLGLREGTEFSAYSTFIYMTYLDWYGVRANNISGTVSSEFNPRIFSGNEEILKVDINSIAEFKTEEDKKKEVLNYTYMMLHPTEGREYRNEMMRSYLNNFVYDTYQKIVYGNSTSYYSSISDNLATRNATGFLSLDPYSDNFMTSWFMSQYTKVAVYIIAVSFILILVVGLFKGRKISWFLIAFTVIINTILIVPSAGEITPMVANNFVQNMFKDKMTYWGVSESVTNANIEADFVNNTSISTGYLTSLSKQEQAQVVELVKTLNVVHLDRSLMVKSDISRKVTQTQSGNYEEIQKLRSARWMLPMIMRQFSANDESKNYVYVPLGDMYDDMSNLYWMYKPDDAITSETVNGQQQTIDDGSGSVANVEDPISVSDRKVYYPDYKDTTINSAGSTIPYRSEAYYRGLTLEDMPHTYSYLLKADATPINRAYGFGGEYKNGKSFEEYVDRSLQSGKAQAFRSTALQLEQQAGTYNRFDRGSVRQSYGYLWATENPYHYFYQSVKDSFDTDISLGALVGKLQGQYTKLEAGNEVRTSFMHAGETGYVRDVADLEELFTNMVPYLYEMQLTTGGFNGRSGVLEDELIGEYDIYKNNYKSWMFRSNWATKLMESPEFTKPAIVRDTKGNKIEIKNPILIDCYPYDRPMIFSEAQMHSLGLHEADLNIVELKAIKVNKDISQRWTMLLNYANVKGMTKEVMMRQMVTEAILAFNAEYSPSGLLNGAYEMYPNGLDLRAISFDSVMKMLMLNVTKDTTYIYGDTMKNIVEDSDIFSASLLLIAAFLCTYIIPLVRNVAMGLIFYLGFVAIIYALLSSNKQKAKVSMGYIISNLIFLALTIAYYAAFSALMAVTTNDAVLTVQNIQVNTGNPVWSFIVIILISIAYIVAMFKMIDFCFKHYRDMGLEVYTAVAGMITEGVTDGVNKLGDKIQSFGGDTGAQTTVSRFKFRGNNSPTDRGYSNVEGQTVAGSADDKYETIDTSKTDREYDERTYEYGDGHYDDAYDAEDIDKEIEKGKKMRDD